MNELMNKLIQQLMFKLLNRQSKGNRRVMA